METSEPSVANKLSDDEAALYDRQIRLWGLEAQNRLKNASVLLVGMSGMGAEIAKNVMLVGLKTLTLLDDQTVSELDMRTNFFLDRTSALHKNRAEASLVRCKRLNPLVALQAVTVETRKIVQKATELINTGTYDLVCCVDRSIDECIKINAACRKCSKFTMFSMGAVYGWFGFCFVDFGDNFEAACEMRKMPPKQEIATAGSGTMSVDIDLEAEPENKRPGTMSVDVDLEAEPEKKRPRLHAGGGDTISKNAMEESDNKFEKETIIVRKQLSFMELSSILSTPNLIGLSGKRRFRTRPPYPVGFYLFHIMAEFRYRFKRIPQYISKAADIRALHLELNAVLQQLGDIKLDLPENFANSLFEQAPAVCAIMGGVLAQEIIKGVSQKDEPIDNFFFYNPFDSVGGVARIPTR